MRASSSSDPPDPNSGPEMVPLPNFAAPLVITMALPKRSSPVPKTAPDEPSATGPQWMPAPEPPPLSLTTECTLVARGPTMKSPEIHVK